MREYFLTNMKYDQIKYTMNSKRFCLKIIIKRQYLILITAKIESFLVQEFFIKILKQNKLIIFILTKRLKSIVFIY